MNNTTRYNRSRYDRSPRTAGINFTQCGPYDQYNGSVIKIPTLDHYVDGAPGWYLLRNISCAVLLIMFLSNIFTVYYVPIHWLYSYSYRSICFFSSYVNLSCVFICYLFHNVESFERWLSNFLSILNIPPRHTRRTLATDLGWRSYKLVN